MVIKRKILRVRRKTKDIERRRTMIADKQLS